MKARTQLLALIAIGVLATLAQAAQAATPFTAGTGSGHDMAVGSDGTGHVVWLTDEADDRVGYCRLPAGGTACDSESTFLDLPGAASTSPNSQVQVFAPAPSKVVILAPCTQCTGVSQRTFRFISTNNGVSFDLGTQVGSLQLNGQASYVNAGDVALSVQGSVFQGQDDPAPTAELVMSTGGASGGASTAVAPGGIKAVYAVNEGAFGNVQYRVFADPDGTATITAAQLNANTAGVPTNWTGINSLSAPEGDSDETRLDSGPNGIYLSYRHNQPGDDSIRVRQFDSTANTFGAPTPVEGADAIENNGIGESMHSQDASGRLHVVWRSLYDGNRLRYTRSDVTGANFSTPANLATRETFFDPMVEAGSDGNGFAVWHGSGDAIRVVPIDPQPEPAGGGPGGGGPGGPDTTRPTAGGLRPGDTTLLPGQGTSFSFNSSEGGVAVLTIQKQVKGMKLRIRGRLRCVPQTRRRIRALHGRRIRRCKAYKRIGSIRQTVSPGRNTINFNGRIAGRRLRPGRYRALLVITDSAGNVSRTERIRFRVLRRRR
jgi:hypothetical protein